MFCFKGSEEELRTPVSSPSALLQPETFEEKKRDLAKVCEIDPGHFRDCDAFVHEFQGKLELLAILAFLEGDTNVNLEPNINCFQSTGVKSAVNLAHGLASLPHKKRIQEMEKPPEELLCAAAITGDCARIRELLLNGADPSYFDSDSMTPLMHAAAGGHADAVRCFLDAGAPWNALSPSNLSAGDLAMENYHKEAFDVLLNFAIQAELVLGTIARGSGGEGTDSYEEYLRERIAFGEDRIMDAESKAVMMAWEKPLMEAHARAICCSGDVGGRILNVGFGMGLVDEAIQRYNPLEHTIVEAHPEVYDRMIRSGWGEKENVKIVFGKWQDVLPQLGSFDGIFFDTYGEYYEDMREFHQHLHRLLKPGGIYSYFNGFCGSNPFFHSVYCHLVSLELENLGYSTQFIPLPVKEEEEDAWKGVRHRYWQLDTYNLPVCQASSLDSE